VPLVLVAHEMSTDPDLWYCIGVVRDGPNPLCSLFFSTMELTNSFPPADAMVKKIQEFDYVKFGDNVVKYSITAYAIAVAVSSYFWTAFQLWWDENGEATQVNFIRFVVNVIDFIAAIVIATPKVYRWVKLNSNRLVDSLFFQYTFA